MNEVTNGTTPVLTPVSDITETGHSLSHVYNHDQGISENHEWIPALALDIHSCSHYKASNMKPMVDAGAASHVCTSCKVSDTFASSPKSVVPSTSAGRNVMHHLGSKTERYVFQSFKYEVSYEVALVVRPILSVGHVDQQKSASRVRSWSKQFEDSTA